MEKVQNTATSVVSRKRIKDEKLKAARMSQIIQCSFDLFQENGIESISFNDIAFNSKIGVASLYRYFPSKNDLVIEVAIYAWKKEAEYFKQLYDSAEYKKLNGYQQLERLFGVFENVLQEHTGFFRFLTYFDVFVKKNKIKDDKLLVYESTIRLFNKLVMDALKKGKLDNSLNFSKSVDSPFAASNDDEIYFTIMHSLFGLSQKLAVSGDMLNMDKEVQSEVQIKLLIKIMLSSIKS